METLPEIRPIPGKRGYAVSACGRVYSYWKNNAPHKPEITNKPQELSPACQAGRYFSITLSADGQSKIPVGVHRLVLMAWQRAPNHKEQARHLDGNPQNNRIENLCWGTAKDNAADRERHGNTMRGAKNGNRKIDAETAKKIYLDVWRGKETQDEIAQKYGVSQATCSDIKFKKKWVDAIGETQ